MAELQSPATGGLAHRRVPMVINIKSMPKHTEMIRLRLYREGSFIIKYGTETLSYLRPPKEDGETEEMDVVSMTSIIRDRQAFFKRIYRGESLQLLYLGKVVGVFQPKVPKNILKQIDSYEIVY